MQRMEKRGLDLFACQDFIAKHGYPYLDDEIMIKNIRDRTYSNPLFAPKEEPVVVANAGGAAA